MALEQTEMFDIPADTTLIVDDVDTSRASPMAVAVVVRMHRSPQRAKCTNCGLRRITYYIGAGNALKSPAYCAKCAGLR